jgi:hypothetical protein
VIKGFLAAAGSLQENTQLFTHNLLADVFIQRFGP